MCDQLRVQTECPAKMLGILCKCKKTFLPFSHLLYRKSAIGHFLYKSNNCLGKYSFNKIDWSSWIPPLCDHMHGSFVILGGREGYCPTRLRSLAQDPNIDCDIEYEQKTVNASVTVDIPSTLLNWLTIRCQRFPFIVNPALQIFYVISDVKEISGKEINRTLLFPPWPLRTFVGVPPPLLRRD